MMDGSETDGQLLQRLYTDPDSSACFTGVERLLAEAKRVRPNIRRKEVEEFLAGQDVYTRHRRVVRRFRRLPTLAAGLHTDWQADLAVMSHLTAANDGYAYMLVCVDVLSRQLFVAPVRSKCSEHVIEAFEHCFRQSKAVPWRLVTDQGKEFTARRVQEFFKQKELQHYCNYTSPTWHAGMAERANRTLKERLYRYFSAKHTYRWVGVVPRLVSAINRSPCSSLNGMRPVDVNFENASRVRQWLRQKLEREQQQHPSLRRARFCVGDHVRIEKFKHVFQKGYHPNFTNEVFEVEQVRRGHLLPITYRLKDRNGEVLRGWFYANDLCRVSADLAEMGQQEINVREPGAAGLDAQQQPVYAIERILKRETRAGVKQLLVRWRGYDASHDSWILANSIVNI
jgi:hypothetical protein